MRNIQKTADEARRILAANRKKGSQLSMSAGEMVTFMERIKGEHPIEAIYEAWLFGFAIGHRAGKRAAKR